MCPDALENGGSAQTAADGAGTPEEAQSLWHELRGLVHDRFRLAALEARQAGESLVAMVAAGVLLAILLGGAWLGLLAAAVLGLVEHGVAASVALLLAVAFNALAAFILCGVIRGQSRHLQFPSTLRSLNPSPPSHRDEGAA